MAEISIGRFRGGLCVFWWDQGKRRRYQLEARTRAEAEPEALDVYRRETLSQRRERATVAEIWDHIALTLGSAQPQKQLPIRAKPFWRILVGIVLTRSQPSCVANMPTTGWQTGSHKARFTPSWGTCEVH